MDKPTAFLSYASEDIEHAQHLYGDLKSYDIDVWFDKESLITGQDWRREIRKAIEKADFFIALISQNYNSKIGFVQSEIQTALNLLDLRPPDRIFIIPARLDLSQTSYPRLAALQWVDLFEDWSSSVAHIIDAIRTHPGYATESEEYKSRLKNLTQKICSLEYSIRDSDVSIELAEMDKLYTNLQEILRNKFAEDYDPLFDALRNLTKGVYKNISELLKNKEIELKSKNLEVLDLQKQASLNKSELDRLNDEIKRLEGQVASLQRGTEMLYPAIETRNHEKWKIAWRRTIEQLQGVFSPPNLTYR